MKANLISLSILCLGLALGCATPKQERAMLPPPHAARLPSRPPPPERLNELMIPQKEEAQKVPERRYSLFARDSDIREVLLAFSKESEFNLIMDPHLEGTVTIDLKQVTLKEALESILSPLGWTYRTDGNFIKILRPQLETRLFTLNYIAARRSGRRETYASTGGTTQTNPFKGQQIGAVTSPQSTVGVGSMTTGYSDLVTVDEMDLWRDIQRGLEGIVFGSTQENEQESIANPGKTTWTRVDGEGKKLIINKGTGVIWVTDFPQSLNKIASFIETVEGSSQRQVTIQAKILEVLLNDEHNEGINWKTIEGLPRSINLAWGLTDKPGTTGYPGGSGGYTTGTESGTIPTPGGFQINPFGGILAIGAAGAEVALSDIVEAISEQGDIKILSSPTISTLNNQKAIIRVGNQDVYFITGAVSTQTSVTQIVQPMTIDIGIILDVTPQIAEDGTIIMNIHPSITEKTGEKVTPDGRSTFPLLSVRETDTTVRVREGQTVIIAGLMQEKTEDTYTGVPGLMSVPVVGSVFRYRSEKKRNVELVIMISPTLQIGRKVDTFSAK